MHCEWLHRSASNLSQNCRYLGLYQYVLTITSQNISQQVQEYIAQFEVTNTTHPTRWRLLQTIDGTGEKQELILRIQGILTLKDLLPIQDR